MKSMHFGVDGFGVGDASRLIRLTSRKLWRQKMPVLAMKGITTFYRRMILFVYPLNNQIPILRPSLSVVIGVLAEKDLDAYHRFRPDQNMKEIRARLARGHRCFACWYEGRIVDAGWIAAGRVYVPYLRRDLILSSGDIYNYDAYTLPAYRGRGVYMARNSYIARYNQKEGYSRSVALVAVENTTPRVVLQRSGLRPIGLYSCLRFGPWQIEWRQPWGGEALIDLSKRHSDSI